jgi:hypothetical protein
MVFILYPWPGTSRFFPALSFGVRAATGGITLPWVLSPILSNSRRRSEAKGCRMNIYLESRLQLPWNEHLQIRRAKARRMNTCKKQYRGGPELLFL